MRPLAVSMGDPSGIGLDIVAQAWSRRVLLQLPAFVLIGSAEALRQRARLLGRDVVIAEVASVAEGASVPPTHLPVIDTPLAAEAVAGRPDTANGAAVIGAIEAAVDAVFRNEAAAVVTCPIAKSVLYAAGFRHPGHTEFLADLARARWPHAPAQPVMMIASDALNVVPLTIHMPLAEVPRAISTDSVVATARIMDAALRADFGILAPRIAVAGLNPHAGEDGSMGSEDRDVIAPAVARLAAEGLHITGPHPADTLFHAARRATYDAVLAMYHDQALIPVKTLAFDTGVNVTLGLPYVRTSPDHGTAFDIAGSGRASPASFIAALRMADAHGRRRAAASGPA